MSLDPWLPKGYSLPDGSTIKQLMYSGEDWQIYALADGGYALVAISPLSNRWISSNVIEASVLKTIPFGEKALRAMTCSASHEMSPLAVLGSPETRADALAFAVALRETRKLTDAPLHDAIYVEQYSRLLPTYTLTTPVDDEHILGAWLTGGVSIPTSSFRRLAALTAWMPEGDLEDVLNAAGIAASKGRAKEEATNDATEEQKKPFALPGRPMLEGFFREHIIDIVENSARYEAVGIDFPSSVVLYGPPGCGKTFAVERLVEYLDWPSYEISSASIGSPYIHETGKKISAVFDEAISNAPAVIVIDEMESFLSSRASDSVGGHHVEEVAEFLRRIPDAINSKVLIIGMTNQIDMIDPAIIRRGRFDHIIEVDMPSRDEVFSLLGSLFERLPLSGDLDITSLASTLAGRPLSDVSFVVREAARLSARSGKDAIDQECVDRAVESLPTSKDVNARIGFL